MIDKRRPIKLGTTIRETLFIMSEGNPGGLKVLVELLEKTNDPLLILSLDDMNIRGWQIWVGYKDYCDQDIHKFIECVKNRDPQMVDKINDEGRRTNSEELAVIGGASFKR